MTFKIFISAALFTFAEQQFNRQLRDSLVEAGFEVFLPQEFNTDEGEKSLFDKCINGIKSSDLVLAVVDGADVDSGVSFEMGFAYGTGIPVVSLRTDFRLRLKQLRGK